MIQYKLGGVENFVNGIQNISSVIIRAQRKCKGSYLHIFLWFWLNCKIVRFIFL